METLLILAILSYSFATYFAIREKVAEISLPNHFSSALIVGLLCNLSYIAITMSQTKEIIGYKAILCIASFTITITTVLVYKFFREKIFSLVSLPCAVVFLICSIFVDKTIAGSHFHQTWFVAHIVLSMTGECFYMIAAITGVFYLYAVRRLKKKNKVRAVSVLPPLTRLDEIGFKLILTGSILFMLGLLTGFYGNYSSFNQITIAFKHVFAFVVLIYYFVLIIARNKFSIIGQRLAYSAILGFILSLGLITIPDNQSHWNTQTMLQEAKHE